MVVDGELRNLTGPNAVDLLRESGGAFASGSAFWGASAIIENPDGTRESRAGAGALPGIFETLGVPLQIGRPWSEAAMGTGGVGAVVITDRLWRSRFGADPDIVGSSLVLNGIPVEITGVTSSGFEFPTLESADFIFPPVTDPATLSRAGLGAFTVLARLRPGITIERARAEVDGIWQGMRAQHPGDLQENGITVMGLQDYMVREVRPALLALLGATSLLLVLACANVANLMLARGSRRDTEMSIRASVGASRGRLVQQLLVESAVLAGAAALGGVLVAGGLLTIFRTVAPPEVPGITVAAPGMRALGFALIAAIVCAVLVGLYPAIRSSAGALSSALRSGTRASAGRAVRRLQGSFVVAQIAAAAVIAIGATLLGRSFARLSSVDPGYRTEGVVIANLAMPNLNADRSTRVQFFQDMERDIGQLPGVQRVGTTLRPPFTSGELSVPVRLEDADGMSLEDAPRVEVGIASGGYFEALEIPILRGRNFAGADRAEGPRVALLSASLARALYGQENPVGRRLAPVLGDWDSATNWATIVGVVGDIRLQGLDAAAVGTLYLANTQMPQAAGTIVLQATGNHGQLARAIRDAVLRVEPLHLDPTVQTLASIRADSLAGPRFNTILLGALSIFALILTTVGIYGLLSYTVASRRLELGIRVAFGADRGSVLRLVISDGMKLAGIGLLAGLLGALVASRMLSGLLFGIEPTDAYTYVGTLGGVAASALSGCLLPAIRAARADTLHARRGE
jgi:putative ABC transport system permease protein